MTYAMSLNNVGFAELTQNEMMCVDGGINWGAIGVGLAAVGLAVAIVGTAGLAAVPVSVIVGAGTAGEIITAGAAVAGSAAGGAAIGYGISHH